MVNKKEQKARKIALWAIGAMVIIWTVLGILSFTEREGYDRPMTKEVTFSNQTALKGQQVFQAYNCMGCHSIVGNGAYFAPDLTTMYNDNGPAWLIAYLGSPATYPTEAIVNVQLKRLIAEGESDVNNLDEYYEKYKAAKARVQERGGVAALMPNLKFSKEEIDALVAYFKYTGKINTAGWPPKVLAKPDVIEKVKREMEEKSGLFREIKTGEEVSSNDPVAMGKKISAEMGCMACHSSDGSKSIGPTWKGIYGQSEKVNGGKTAKVDDAFLHRAIFQPEAEVADGFQKGVMPSYDGTVSEEQAGHIIAYIKSIK